MTAWDAVPITFLQAVTCPHCGCGARVIIRTLQGGDGSKSQRSVCRRCSRRFLVVWELPENGSTEQDTA